MEHGFKQDLIMSPFISSLNVPLQRSCAPPSCQRIKRCESIRPARRGGPEFRSFFSQARVPRSRRHARCARD
uniref:Uncharacterized protein n=1 Tax=Daphnia galeata TaxID=27404 RepID=A0A8J2WVG1_9CRUS|nr:unnamed protein product [Daphnia galeata]